MKAPADVPVEWHLPYVFPPDSPFGTLQGNERLAVRDALFQAMAVLSRPPLGNFELDVNGIETGEVGVPYIQAEIQKQLDAASATSKGGANLGYTVGEPIEGCVYYEFVNGRPKCIMCLQLLRGGEEVTHTVPSSAGPVSATYHVGIGFFVG